MLPGFLHFDLRRGCSADKLLSSLIALVGDYKIFESAFKQIGMSEINLVAIKDAVNGLKGQVIQFYVDDILIKRDVREASKNCDNLQKNFPRWHVQKNTVCNLSDNKKTLENFSQVFSRHQFVEACLNQQKISLSEIEQLFDHPKLKPEVSALAIKILENLYCDDFVSQKLSGMEALWTFCHLFTLVVAINSLDPKYISATKIYFGCEKFIDDKISGLHLAHPVWIQQVLRMVPSFECSEKIDLDVLALSFVKTLVGHFGPRGESVILQLGIGLSPKSDHISFQFVEALWCEANLPQSMNEIGPTNYARVSMRYKIEGLVPSTQDISSLASMMSLHKAQSLSYSLVHAEGNNCFYLVRFSVSDEYKREAIEAFLIKAHAQNVSVSIIEHHQLNKRIVSVPLGKGNKTSSSRFYEYIYLDKVVRVEPHKEDLDFYIKNTDLSVEVARADLLLAWKKWRGRIVEE
ncbi:MAG: DUF111 family protein [Myxococcales bacterium]|nr:DUF111 family protein [Myxococcales bacterium]USN51811.1 MAG: DUF111 family protein [Myxococcales bacterium]